MHSEYSQSAMCESRNSVSLGRKKFFHSVVRGYCVSDVCFTSEVIQRDSPHLASISQFSARKSKTNASYFILFLFCYQ